MHTTALEAQTAQRRASARSKTSQNAPRLRSPTSTKSEYARASSEYQTSTGLTAHSQATASATRGANRIRNTRNATGTTSAPARAEGSRNTASEPESTAWLRSQESQ